jgi:hypothetical protein
MDSGPRIFLKIFLSFPVPPPTNYTLSFLIYKKSLKFDGGYCSRAAEEAAAFLVAAAARGIWLVADSIGIEYAGCGAVSQGWCAYVPWARKINCGVKAADGIKLSRKLSALELVELLICVAAGAGWCRNQPVRVWVDNAGSVMIWKKGYSTRCKLCTTLVKAIGTVAAGIGCVLVVE